MLRKRAGKLKVLKWNIGSQKACVETLEEYEWKSRRGRTSIPEEDYAKNPFRSLVSHDPC